MTSRVNGIWWPSPRELMIAHRDLEGGRIRNQSGPTRAQESDGLGSRQADRRYRGDGVDPLGLKYNRSHPNPSATASLGAPGSIDVQRTALVAAPLPVSVGGLGSCSNRRVFTEAEVERLLLLSRATRCGHSIGLIGGGAAHAYAADIRRDHAILMEDLRTLSETLATQRAAYR